MAYKTLIIDEYHNKDGYKNLTLLSGSVKEEAIVAEFHTNNVGSNPDLIELAVNLADMKRIRDFLNTIIKKVEKNYEAN